MYLPSNCNILNLSIIKGTVTEIVTEAKLSINFIDIHGLSIQLMTLAPA